MTNSDITLIFPIDFSRRGQEILSRAKSQCQFAIANGYNAVFGHNNRDAQADTEFHAYVASLRSERIKISCYDDDDSINLSKLRNVAVQKTQTKYIVLLDIDLVITNDKIQDMREVLQTRKSIFVMLPCLYLTLRGNKVIKVPNGERYILNDYFRGLSYRYVQHLAIPSSVLMLETDLYKKLDGFDEGYTNHGYEDFDFMLKLMIANGEILPQHTIIDEPYKAPMLARGFRAIFATHCIEFILHQQFAFHLYHKKVHMESYYEARKENAKMFQKKLCQFIELSEKNASAVQNHNNVMILMRTLYQQVDEKGLSINDFAVLFQSPVRRKKRMQILKWVQNLMVELNGAFHGHK